MDLLLALIAAVALLIAIGIISGLIGQSSLADWWRSEQTQSRKTKTKRTR